MMCMNSRVQCVIMMEYLNPEAWPDISECVCKNARYCKREYQQQDWPRHKKWCSAVIKDASLGEKDEAPRASA